MKTLYLLVGNIGSGKSYWTRDNIKNKYLISRDKLRYMLGYGKYIFDRRFETCIEKTERYMVNEFMKTSEDLIIDECHFNKKLRKRHIDLAKKNGYKVYAIVMEKLPKEACVQARLDEPHGDFTKEVWESVWERFNAGYEEPEKEEGIDRIVKVRR